MRHLLYIALSLSLILCCAAAGARVSSRPSEQDRAKAAYIFLEAASQIEQSEPGTAFMMLRYAQQIVPDDPDINGLLGEILLATGAGDSAQMAQAYQALDRRFFANTKDYQNGLRFARVAERMRRFSDLKRIYAALCEAYPDRAEYSLEYAWYRALEYMQGDTAAIADANAIYDRIEQGTGVDLTLTLHRLRSLALSSDTTEMIRQISRYVATAPADAEVALAAGNMYGYIEMPDSAMAYFNKACMLDSTFGEAYQARAEAYFAEGDTLAYEREVVRALESPSLDFEPKIDMLTNYMQVMHDDTARKDELIKLLADLEDMHPGEPMVYRLAGAYYAVLDSMNVAAEQFGYAMDLDPTNEQYLRFRLETQTSAKDTLGVLETARLGMERFDNLYYYVIASQTLYGMNRMGEGLDILDSVPDGLLVEKEHRSLVEQMKGDLLYGMHRNDSAFLAYERAIELNPANYLAMNNAAYHMAVENIDLDRARRYAQLAVQAEPLNPTFLDTYAWVLFKRKDYPAAKVQIDAALDVYGDPETAVVDSLLSEFEDAVHEQFVQTDSVAVDEVIELDVDEQAEEPSAEILDHAGDIYFMNGEPEQAVIFWQRALATDPTKTYIKKKIDNKAYFFE